MKRIYSYTNLLFIALNLWILPVRATTYNFTGSGNWSDAAQWDASGVAPYILNSGDVVNINCSIGGHCNLDNGLTVGTGAVLNVIRGDLKLVSTMSPIMLTNAGQIVVNTDGKLILAALSGNNISNNNTMDIYGQLQIGDNNIDNAGTLNIKSGGVLSLLGGVVNIGTGGILSNSGTFNNSEGGIVGNGTWENFATYNCDSGAFISPDGTAKLTITSNLTQCSDGAIQMVIFGNTQGVTYNWIDMTGNLDLNSSILDVTLDPSYTPTVGQTFDIITAATINGTFNPLSIILPAGFAISYPTGKVRLTYTGSLPVELIHFTGKNTEGGNELTWQTATETKTDHFSIETSSDGIKFNSLGSVKATGSNSTYGFIDKSPIYKITYYRLKTTDTDGSFEYSKTITVEAKSKMGKLWVYPNPVFEKLTFRSADDIEDFSIVNLVGQVVLHGKTNSTIDVSNLSKGIYVLKQGNEQVTFVKE